MSRRTRTCDNCGKQLGGTLGLCYNCGGEKPSPSRSERLQDAWNWKMYLGLSPNRVQAAHEP